MHNENRRFGGTYYEATTLVCVAFHFGSRIGSLGAERYHTQPKFNGSRHLAQFQFEHAEQYPEFDLYAGEPGRIVKLETDYFLQPENGQPVKLNSSQDLNQHVGHRVRIEGNIDNGLNVSGSSRQANPSASTGKMENDSSSPSGTQYQTINVTRVDMISESCPSGMQNQSAPTKNSRPSPK